MTAATVTVTLLSKISLTKFTAAKVRPHSSATRVSFHTTRKISENLICCRLMPRMIVAEAWLPQLPPVSISMGMDAVSTRYDDSADS